MNITQLALDRQRAAKEAEIKEKADRKQSELLAFEKSIESQQLEKNPPILDVKSFFSEPLLETNSLLETNPFLMSDEENYKAFLLKEKMKEAEKELLEIGCVSDLSDFFRQNKQVLSEEQVSAFSGIESLREFMASQNCNCAVKRAQLEQYYRDFVIGNANTDLFLALKSNTKLKKIIFFHENQEIHQI